MKVHFDNCVRSSPEAKYCWTFVMETLTLTRGHVTVGLIFLTFIALSIITNVFNIQIPHQLKFYHKWKSIFQLNMLRKSNSRQPRWEPRLLFSHTCQLHTTCSGRSCCEKNENYQKLHLVSPHLSMNDTIELFRRKIHNKTLTFIGDSLTSQLYLSFLDVLDPTFNQTISNTDTKCKCLFCDRRQPETGLNFNLRGLCKLGTPNCDKIQDQRCTTVKTFQSFVLKSDIILLNMGLHYHLHPEQDYVTIITKLADILQREQLKHTTKQVIVRSTLPQHFSTNDGLYMPKGNLIHKGCSNKSMHNEHWTNQHLKTIAQQYGFKYMDSAPFYVDRWDLHANPRDCTHSCLTAEVTIPEMALLNSLLD